jgi:hypothetical protein
MMNYYAPRSNIASSTPVLTLDISPNQQVQIPLIIKGKKSST